MTKLELYQMSNKTDIEPAVGSGTAVSFMAAIYVLVNTFWPDVLSDKVQDAITTIIMILIPIVTGILIRRRVWSPNSVNQLVKELTADGKTEPPKPDAPKLL